MPERASRTMSRDHHSPTVSSERATGHRLALKDLCRIAPRILIADKNWLHHYTRFKHPISGCIMQLGWRKAGWSTVPLARSETQYESQIETQRRNIPMKGQTLVRIFLVAMLFLVSKEGLMSQT